MPGRQVVRDRQSLKKLVVSIELDELSLLVLYNREEEKVFCQTIDAQLAK